jgi:hypothetical protein
MLAAVGLRVTYCRRSVVLPRNGVDPYVVGVGSKANFSDRAPILNLKIGGGFVCYIDLIYVQT